MFLYVSLSYQFLCQLVILCATYISGTLDAAFELDFSYNKFMNKKRAEVRSLKSSPLPLPYNISVFLS